VKSLLALALCTALTAPALALETPAPGKADPHIRTVAYHAEQSVLVTGIIGRSLTITFSPKETIKLAIFGDMMTAGGGTAWTGPDPKKMTGHVRNVLPLWPQKVGHSNMQVITTTESGDDRVYQFTLVALPAGPVADCDKADCLPPEVIEGLTFTYPGDVAKAAAKVAAVKRARQQKKVAEDRLATDVFYGPRNWKYEAQGRDKEIAPTSVSDNGRLTAFEFKGLRETPAIYIVHRVGGEEHEALAPFTIKDDLVVVQTIAEHFRLRLGRAVLDVWNRAYNPEGRDPATGTTSPDVIREVVSR
jgi:type IV secretion system protein VirB9